MKKNGEVHISIVTPVYGCKQALYELYFRLKDTLEKITIDFEIIMVNDASPDNAWETIKELAKKDKRVKGINLSRNFGQHFAITAGLNYTKGEWVVVMDCDLQDQPEEITKLYDKAMEGYDYVVGLRIQRNDKFMKKFSSHIFNSAFTYLSGINKIKKVINFGIYSSKVILEFNKMKDRARSFRSLVNYLGFKSYAIEVEHARRPYGKSTYTISKLFQLALDDIISNSDKLLKVTIKIGLTISLFAFSLAIYNVISFFTGLIEVPGFTSTIFSIWFVGGLLILFMGVIGLYIGKIFDQVKGRQLYIVSETINVNKESKS
jgi:polyisoprenyl-phosphate glycosyltransferase